MNRPFIAVGDLVKTGYGTGPYQVYSVYYYAPLAEECSAFVLRDYQAFSLVCDVPNARRYKSDQDSFLNGVAWSGDRWQMDCGGEVIVLGQEARRGQVGLFDAISGPPAWVPYGYQPGVDYAGGAMERCGCPGLRLDRARWTLWHCNECGLDFHLAPKPHEGCGRFEPCPQCRWPTDPLVYFTM